MYNKWSLHVRNFGKIKDAKITVSPFMIFLGKNNSGKSYILTLLWGILKEAKSLVNENLRHQAGFNRLFKEMKPIFSQLNKNGTAKIDEQIQIKLFDLFNQILNTQKEKLLKRIFNYPVSIGYIKIDPINLFNISLKLEEEEKVIESEQNDLKVLDKRYIVTVLFNNEAIHKLRYETTSTLGTSAIETFVIRHIMGLILLSMLGNQYFSGISTESERTQPLYLPASRSGFMHTYRAILGNLFIKDQVNGEFHIESMDNEEDATLLGTSLNMPTVYFLQRLQKHSTNERQEEKNRDIIEFINNQVLNGRIVKDKQANFKYIPQFSEAMLPLHVTSSLVAELSPISIFLSSDYDPDLWIMEEVESHLHMEIQLKIARLFNKLLHKKKAVWITTHGDNLMQQLNNLFTLSTHPQKEEIMQQLGLNETDLLPDLDMVTAYQFVNEDGVTNVEQLELGQYGFEIRSFNDTLERLIHETDLIQNYERNQYE